MAKGIPTLYEGVQFRSRLEAKWASFFDICKWPWSYEPFDLDGWIPDFAIGDRLQTLVEIKPIFSVREMSKDAVGKINRASEEYKGIIVLGADPTVWADGQADCGCPCVGARKEYSGQDGDPYMIFEDVHFGFTQGNGKPGLCSWPGAWFNSIWSGRDAGHKNARVYGDNSRIDARTLLVTAWRRACNVTQWKPKQGNQSCQQMPTPR